MGEPVGGSLDRADAVRFLRRTTFGPTPEDVTELERIGVDAWLAATFGRWLGVGEGDLTAVAPNLANVGPRDLGLFDPGPVPDPPPTTVTTIPTTVPTTIQPTTEPDDVRCPPLLPLDDPATTTGG